MFAAGETSAQNAASPASIQGDDGRAPHRTELFLDNQMLEATPGVSRRLHPAKKHLLNPVIRCDRWCDGDYMEPYTTMYDEEEKLFKMWARAGSDSKAGYVGGNAAYMLYFTSADGIRWAKPDLGVIRPPSSQYSGCALSGSASLPDARLLSTRSRANLLTFWYLPSQITIGVHAR